MVALLASATPAGASVPPAAPAAEDLVRYLTDGRLKPDKRVSYFAECSSDCQLTARTTLVLKGPDLPPVTVTGQLRAGQVAEAFLKPNRAARRAIRSNLSAARLRTVVKATDALTGEVDIDRRTFRFKR
jgi:hypothetical protein